MIGQTVILADESAAFRVGGLTQLERLILSVEDFKAGCPGTIMPSEPTVVLWKQGCFDEAAAHTAHRRGIPVLHLVTDSDRPAGSGPGLCAPPPGSLRLLANTTFLPGRGALEYLLGDPGSEGENRHSLPLAILPPPAPGMEEGEETWESLSGRLPPRDLVENGSTSPGEGEERHVFFTVVDSPGDIEARERQLFSSLGKNSDGFSARAINRRLSAPLSRLLSRTTVTPNMVSFAILAVIFTAAWLLAQGTRLSLFGGVLLYDAVSILDGCDGELARVKFMESDSGAWIDTLSDMFGHHLFVFALALGLSRQTGISPGMSDFYLVEGVVTVLLMALTLWGVARFSRERGGQGQFTGFGPSVIGDSPLKGHFKTAATFISQLSRRDTYAHLFVLAAAAGRASWILHAFAIGVVGHIAALLYGMRPGAGKSQC